MLKVQSNKKSLPDQLMSKAREIVVTNVCNLTCGGCCQLIGQFRKNQLWFIEIEELERCINILKKYPSTATGKQPITIFGGEPTLHPKWNEIVKMLRSHAPTEFWINTNGRLGHERYQKDGNLVWWVDLHPDSQKFTQTLYAAADAINLPDDMAYWRKAQKDCPIWNGCQCSIYRNKAYFCETAAALDYLFHDGIHGWEVTVDRNPFNRTKEEIDEQARHLCKRCGWCVEDIVPRQLSKDPTYVSPMNQTDHSGRRSLPVVEPVVVQRWVNNPPEGDMPNIGIYRLHGEQRHAIEIQESDAKLPVQVNEAEDRQQAVDTGRSRHEWTIVLDANQVLPINAFYTIWKWVVAERIRPLTRKHFSLPVYEMPLIKYNHDMLEPRHMARNVALAFHNSSEEIFDEGIYSRLGHRNLVEGSGRTSLWHDRLTDIVGGVVNLY